MTLLLVLLYACAAALELAAVGLIVYDVRDSRRRWDSYRAGIEQEESAMASDLRFRLDPMISRYGFTPAQIMRTIGTVESLVEVKRWRQNLAVGSIFGGIILGLIGNLASLAA
ncbi:hypothetical protein ACFTSF_27310 [Kribbella sp. NPDC056951]|uniref:hypothetical protein n=1 Tax=Kribbella sp. NPDC056951 TaxID=3345978 RepID=UPI00362A3EEA